MPLAAPPPSPPAGVRSSPEPPPSGRHRLRSAGTAPVAARRPLDPHHRPEAPGSVALRAGTAPSGSGFAFWTAPWPLSLLLTACDAARVRLRLMLRHFIRPLMLARPPAAPAARRFVASLGPQGAVQKNGCPGRGGGGGDGHYGWMG